MKKTETRAFILFSHILSRTFTSFDQSSVVKTTIILTHRSRWRWRNKFCCEPATFWIVRTREFLLIRNSHFERARERVCELPPLLRRIVHYQSAGQFREQFAELLTWIHPMNNQLTQNVKGICLTCCAMR